MTHCQDCGHPWGVVLKRGEMPTPETVELCRLELVEQWLEQAECDEDEGVKFDTSKLPPVKVVEVVYLTEALARFCDENGICDPCFADDCWQELEWVDLPGWLLKGRKRRWAVRWDCCNIGWTSNYVVSEALPARSDALT